jgi:leucyl-tRNA synthetase
MADRYEPAEFEQKWRDRWKEADLFRTREAEGAPKFYGLDFFPYPSGAGLSVGHCRNYVPTDVICRMKAMQGYNVLHPMGFDAFGLPAENEAIKRQSHPSPMIDRYAENYCRQMELIGVGYDWSRSFKSSDPSYYRWTQWVFQLLYKRGLAYRKQASVNWDPVDKTVLADEEVVAGRAERSGALVEKKWIPQWFFKITDYAQRLIDDLDGLDWPEGIKAQQRNWIGRSEGVEFEMTVADLQEATDNDPTDDFEIIASHKLSFRVFTTRVDTVFGMTFCVLSPEHPLVDVLTPLVDAASREAVQHYQAQAKAMSDTERTAEAREKTGVFTGAYAINPANGKRVPIWIADYVLAGYGTGAIMAVPGHDQRDFDFAVKYGLDVIPVIQPTEDYLRTFALNLEQTFDEMLSAYSDNPKAYSPVFESKDSVLMNSGEYTGLTVQEAQTCLGTWMEGLGIGERKVQYKLRDWLISRQRYWGCPIPVIHTRDGEEQLAPENTLPVLLPEVENYQPTGDGSSPLAHIDEFLNVTDLDGRLGRRETDTMGGFACSSWYFLRFCDPHNEDAAWDVNVANYWMPVDCYVGGAEHAVMHLLYARFWTKVLHDAGLIDAKEPFQRLENQGQVLALTPYRKPREDEKLDIGEDGILVSFEEAKSLDPEQIFHRWARMSKSKGNVVTPDEAVAEYGADALRMYLLFVAPFNADVQWSNEGMAGQSRFLSRIFRLVEEWKGVYDALWPQKIGIEEVDDVMARSRRLTHQTIRRCTEDIERFSFNTYISWLMKYVNGLSEIWGPMSSSGLNDGQALALSEALETIVLLISPAAPHSADELNEMLGRTGFTYDYAWPKDDPVLAAEESVTIAVQVNGKLRDTFVCSVGATVEALEEAALALPKVQGHLDGKTVRKVIVVPGKLVNVVAS